MNWRVFWVTLIAGLGIMSVLIGLVTALFDWPLGLLTLIVGIVTISLAAGLHHD